MSLPMGVPKWPMQPSHDSSMRGTSPRPPRQGTSSRNRHAITQNSRCAMRWSMDVSLTRPGTSRCPESRQRSDTQSHSPRFVTSRFLRSQSIARQYRLSVQRKRHSSSSTRLLPRKLERMSRFQRSSTRSFLPMLCQSRLLQWSPCTMRLLSLRSPFQSSTQLRSICLLLMRRQPFMTSLYVLSLAKKTFTKRPSTAAQPRSITRLQNSLCTRNQSL